MASSSRAGSWRAGRDIHGGVALARKLGIISVFGRDEQPAEASSMNPKARDVPVAFFADAIKRVDGLLDLDPMVWRPPAVAEP